MRRQIGFTLIELMIVVTIIGVLAVVAGTAFRRYSASGRAAEAMSMIGEFKIKEEAYRAENNAYISTDATEGTLTPALGSCAEPCPKLLPARPWTTAPMLYWAQLGINPGRAQLYCGYVVIAGLANAWGTAGTDGKNAFGNVAPNAPWFYIEAKCDNKRDDITHDTTYTATNSSSTVITQWEGE
jgi:prepilin-type N-terminal cleavage/methylation domain-containing protein